MKGNSDNHLSTLKKRRDSLGYLQQENTIRKALNFREFWN